MKQNKQDNEANYRKVKADTTKLNASLALDSLNDE